MQAGRRIGTLRAVVAASTLAIVAVLAVAPAFGCGATGGSAQVRPARAEAGAVVEVSGSMFRPEMGMVAVKWGTASGVLLAQAAVDAAGSFGPVPITIPASAEPARFYQISVYQPNDPSARVSNFAFEVTGTPAPVATQPQPTPEPVPAPQPAPSATPAPAPVAQSTQAQTTPSAAAPAPANAPSAAAARAPRPAPAAATAPVDPATPSPAAAPAPAPVAATAPAPAFDLPELTETDPAGIGATGAPAPVQPLVVSDPAAMGGPRTIDGGPSLWLLVPLVGVGLTLFAASGAIVVHEVRRRRQPVEA